MKKKSKYRPRACRVDPVGFVIEGLQRYCQVGDVALKAQIVNHEALLKMARGTATATDCDVIVTAMNVAEGLCRTAPKLGRDWMPELEAGQRALHAVATRGVRTGRFVMTGPEMQAINLAMSIHDAQLEVTTIREFEVACDHVRANVNNNYSLLITA